MKRKVVESTDPPAVVCGACYLPPISAPVGSPAGASGHALRCRWSCQWLGHPVEVLPVIFALFVAVCVLIGIFLGTKSGVSLSSGTVLSPAAAPRCGAFEASASRPRREKFSSATASQSGLFMIWRS